MPVPPPGDYHVHTRFSDGEGEPAQCVERARALGLPAIGFADHLAPRCVDPNDEWSVGSTQLEAYVCAVREAAARYPDIAVLLGVEADYVPEAEGELAQMLAAYPFDYVIGAVHFVDGFCYDDPATREDPRWHDAASLYRRYYALVSRAVGSGLFDVLAHLDYVMLWGRRSAADISSAEDEALAAIAAAGVAVEINTSGTLEPAGLMHPAPDLLARACRLDIPVVFGSDAHEVDQVGWKFDAAAAFARRAGYGACLELSSGVQKPLP